MLDGDAGDDDRVGFFGLSHPVQIDNMTCGGCARSVAKAIHSLDPQPKVDIDLPLKRVSVESGADESAVAAVRKEVGYPPRRGA